MQETHKDQGTDAFEDAERERRKRAAERFLERRRESGKIAVSTEETLELIREGRRF